MLQKLMNNIPIHQQNPSRIILVKGCSIIAEPKWSVTCTWSSKILNHSWPCSNHVQPWLAMIFFALGFHRGSFEITNEHTTIPYTCKSRQWQNMIQELQLLHYQPADPFFLKQGNGLQPHTSESIVERMVKSHLSSALMVKCFYSRWKSAMQCPSTPHPHQWCQFNRKHWKNSQNLSEA